MDISDNYTLLIERSKQGDTRAFSQLYSLYATDMFQAVKLLIMG